MSSPSNQSLPREAGGFLLLRELGRGGMGVVYEAEELESKRVVALKVLTGEADLPPEIFQRFEQEARLAAAISDPHCVFVYGAHEVDGVPAIAMELCTGDTLEDRMGSDEPIAIADALRWILEVVDGLDAAQRAGVIHRDMKPSNCFFTEDGHVKVGDFGLSRSTQHDVQLTQAGAFLGSPLFASPEQIRGREVDVRSDIYSVGATLYALLTGVPPHHGDNMGEVLARILSEEPPDPCSLRKEIPRGLANAVLRMLAKNPNERPADYEKVRESLDPFVPKTVEAGGLGRRAGAWLVDGFVMSITNQAVMVLAASSGSGLRIDPTTMRISSWYAELALGLWPLLYFGFTEGRFGASLGKWFVGQRVVSVADGHYTLKGSFIRAACYTLAPQITIRSVLHLAGDFPFASLIAVPFSLMVSAALLSTFRRRNGFRGVHEFASGTRVIQRPSPFYRPKLEAELERAPIEHPDDLPETLGSYSIVGMVGRTSSGRVLLGRDSELRREVWIHDGDRVGGGTHSRAGKRSCRLRWLESVSDAQQRYHVFEDPGGQRLVDFAEPHEWPFVSRALVALTAELAERPDERFHVEQLWVDRARNLRLLDFPVGEPGEALTAPELLTAATHTMLGEAKQLPQTLPVHAEPAMRKILGLEPAFDTIQSANEVVRSWAGRTVVVTQAARLGQLALSVGLPAIMIAAIVVTTFLSVALTGGVSNPMHNLMTLDKDGTRGAELSEADRDAHLVIVARYFTSPAGDAYTSFMPPKLVPIKDEALERYPNPTEADVELARKQLGEEDARDAGPAIVAILLVSCTFMCGLCSSFSSFVFRGALSFNAFGFQLRNRRGERASRLRCLWRSTIGWASFMLLGIVPIVFLSLGQIMTAIVTMCVIPLLYLGVIVHAVHRPSRSLPDILSGTRIVPR